jgi:DinB family protein
VDPSQVIRDSNGAFRCRECGFRYALSAGEMVDVCTDTVVRFRQAALAIPTELRGRRTAPAVWSPNAYCAHMADAAELIESRVRRMATEERPFLAGYDQDQAAELGRFDERPVEPSLRRVDRAVAHFVALVSSLPGDGWQRIGAHEEAGDVKLRDIAHDMPHELTHHTADLQRIGAELQQAR